MADVKSMLKEARKFIDDKNYEQAQECCKNILRKDKQNYFALVLLGKSLQNSEQAPLAYQKAIASKRDHPLAWQGLANCYETKNDDVSKQKLLNIYKEMLYLPIEEEKMVEIINKICHIGVVLKNSESIKILVEFINKGQNDLLKKTAEIQLLEILKNDVSCCEENIDSLQNILTEIYSKDPNQELEIFICKVILQKNIIAALEELSQQSFFNSNVPLREYVCKFLCVKYMENMSFNGLDIDKHIDGLTNSIETSKYPGILRSMWFYDKGLYQDAYKQCVPLINYQESDEIEAIFIIKCTIMLKKWSVAQKLAVNFINKCKQENLLYQLRKYLFFALAKQNKWKQAIANAKMLDADTLNIEEKACLAECYIEINDAVDQVPDLLMQDLKSTEYYMQLQALIFIKQNNYEDVINLLANTTENALHSYYLGKAYWELKEFDKGLVNLLKAAKLNPEHSETFLYLGHYYYYHKNDYFKAKKCYEKAYSLNNQDINKVKMLSEAYLKLQQTEADFELLRTFTQNVNIVEPWVNLRLGLHYLNKSDWENAIINFRYVIKSNQNDATGLECLADAYYSRGSYTSALRAYNKVITLDASKSSHCLNRIGYIYSLLTEYQEAISTFEKVLKLDPNSYLALKGMAETWMRIAKKKMTAKTYGSARDCAQNAVAYIMRALKSQNQFICFWKLLADTLMFIIKLPDQYAYVYMSQNSNNSSVLDKTEKNDIFPQAIACYSYIAKQTHQAATYDLAYAYYHYYNATQKKKYCHISLNLVTVCIKDKSSSWRNWNLLGKIYISLKNYNLAQHCFIKALKATRKLSTAKIWCNLGALYLKLKLNKLANYCFWRAQSTLPSYPQSWIGQALLAELIREEEAMDLFRHASRLGYHPESALGYADWVCRTLKDNKYTQDSESKYVIEGLFAIPYAMDLLAWFINYEPNNACALNILGVLQERSGLIKPAIKSYEKAFKYAEDGNKNIVLLNIGRILLRFERYEEAVKIYKAVSEASFNSAAGLALSLFKSGSYEESYTAYETALHWLTDNETEKSDLLVAMAGIVYMFKGLNDAKTILFHSIQTSQNKPTPHCLFAICSLGIIHSEQSLTKLAISELRKFETDNQYGFDIGFLKSYYFVIENDIEHAIKLLSESLHDHPSNALLWHCMAQYCLRLPDTKAKVASCCAQKALYSAHYGKQNGNMANILASASIAEHISGNKNKALALAKEGLHVYPNQAEIWAALLFSLLSHNLWVEKKNWILTAAGHMRRHLEISRPLSRWVSLMEKKLSK